MDDTDARVSTFPDLPPFYRLYSDEHIQKGLSLPPPPPVVGPYEMFGEHYDTNDPIIRSLESQDIKQLYPDNPDSQVELKKLNHSILVCFLELLDILITNPSSEKRTEKIEDLKLLFINMHHLINEFRPHQARETLKVILERQYLQREDMMNTLQRSMDTARHRLKECKMIAQKLKEELERKRKSPNPQKPEPMDSSSSALNTVAQSDVVSGESEDLSMCDCIDMFIQSVESSGVQ